MNSQAKQFELSLQPIADRELIAVGASLGSDGVWTFPDGHRGKILARPIGVYSDDKMSERVGTCFFEAVE